MVIDWPGLERSWYRWADRNQFGVNAITEEPLLIAAMPDWQELTLDWPQLALLPTAWQAALAQWRGVYLIIDQSDGKQYVGSAYGRENILQRWLGYARTGHGGNKLLKNRDPNDFVFYDGSGLSSHDLVTPRAIAKLLQFATTQPWFASWKASLSIGGEDGTLETRSPHPPLKDHLFAKTGTLGEARALSGYLDAASGRTVIFSILVDNHLPGTSADRDVMDKIVAAMRA